MLRLIRKTSINIRFTLSILFIYMNLFYHIKFHYFKLLNNFDLCREYREYREYRGENREIREFSRFLYFDNETDFLFK